MSNLKKILALVLALVMSLSLVTVASAYKDDADVSETYEDAITVLSALGVFEGENGNFYPQRNITRAETAAILYRIVTGDVNDTQDHIYADYGKFTDVNKNMWYAGYIGYCANAELIKGYGGNKFGPQDNVTGYQVLAMILRAIGYGQNGEFQGTGWEIRTASQAKKLGILDNITESTLGKAATREMVAEMLYQGLLVTQVDYTTAFGYSTYGNNTIGFDTFGLVSKTADVDNVWGQPAKTWYYKADKDNINTAKKTYLVDIPYDAVAEYTTAVTECDIAAAVGFTGTKTYNTYVNGKVNASKYAVQATDVVTKIGAQGRLTQVYEDRIVMIDTMLAQVTNVTEAKFDTAGHLYKQAELTLKVFDGQAPNGYTQVVLSSNTNWSYAVGEMLLVNAVTNAASVTGTHTSVTSNNNSSRMYVAIVGAAESFVGSQTIIHYNAGKHTVNGTDYLDANCFHLDEAQKQTSNHTWWLDQYGNLIGATDIATQYTYGVIKNIQWINPVGAAGYAQATIVYMDGSEQTQTIASLNGYALSYSGTGSQAPGFGVNTWYVSTDIELNYSVYAGSALYRIETNASGALVLNAVANAGINGDRLTQADVKTSVSAITGTGAATAYTNSNTQYLVRNNSASAHYTYTPVTGYNNIGNFTGADVTVDYVDVDGNGYAEYVYIMGTPDNATGFGLFYLTTTSYREVLLANGNVDYYELTGYVNGELKTIQIPASAKVAALDVILPAAGATANTLFTVNFTNGQVTSASKVTTVTDLGTVGVYANMNANYLNTANGNVTYTADALRQGNTVYNVTTATRVYGDLSAVMDSHDVYVVYDDNGYAKEIYVAEKALPSIPSGVNPENATIVYSLKMYNGSTLVGTRTSTWSGAAGTYPSQNFASIAASYWPDIVQANWNILVDQNSITVGAGQTVVLEYIITAK